MDYHEGKEMLSRVRELEGEVAALKTVFDDAPHYHNAVVLQNRAKERRDLIVALRREVRVVSSNEFLA